MVSSQSQDAESQELEDLGMDIFKSAYPTVLFELSVIT
jgi:hypothetical protein